MGFEDGDFYVGEVKQMVTGEVPHGKYGVYQYADGRQRFGAWRKGEEHGPGIECEDDECKTGNWDNGQRISGKTDEPAPRRRMSENEPEIEDPAQQNNVHSTNYFIVIIITTISVGMMIILSFFIYIR